MIARVDSENANRHTANGAGPGAAQAPPVRSPEAERPQAEPVSEAVVIAARDAAWSREIGVRHTTPPRGSDGPPVVEGLTTTRNTVHRTTASPHPGGTFFAPTTTSHRRAG